VGGVVSQTRWYEQAFFYFAEKLLKVLSTLTTLSPTHLSSQKGVPGCPSRPSCLYSKSLLLLLIRNTKKRISNLTQPMPLCRVHESSNRAPFLSRPPHHS
jgi:hypothetical protein